MPPSGELEGAPSPGPARTPRSEGRTTGPGRPEDTVVFLFTDIEASSRRWEGDQDAMAQDLARHDELLRGAVDDARGRVFADTGDGLPIHEGEERLREVVRLGLEAGVDGEVARARYFLGELASSRGDPVEAEPLLQAALESFEAMDAPFSAAWCHHALGWMAMARGERRLAQDHFEYILELTRRHVAAELLRVHAVAGLAPLAALAGNPELAEALADDGVTVARRLPAPGFLVMALTRAGETALLGRRPTAVLRESLNLLVDLGARAWVDEVLEMVALVCEEDGAPAAAQLLGAAGARSDRRGRILSNEVSGCYDRLAKTLGPDAFTEHEAAGRSMSAGEALSFALSALDASHPPVLR